MCPPPTPKQPPEKTIQNLCKNMIRTDLLQKKRSGMTVCKLQMMITENLMIFMASIVLTFAQLFKVWFHIAFKTVCSKYIPHHSIPCNLPWPQNHGKLLQCLSDWRWGSGEKTSEGKNYEICSWPKSKLLGFRLVLFLQNVTLSSSNLFAFALDYHKFNLCANPDKIWPDHPFSTTDRCRQGSRLGWRIQRCPHRPHLEKTV